MLDPDANEPAVVEALLHFHVCFADAWTARQVGGHMTCQEADAVAGLMELVRPHEAHAFLYGHANAEDPPGDVPGDAHYWMSDAYDPAAQDRDHMPDFPRDPAGRICPNCELPVELRGETFYHLGVDEALRESYRKMGDR